MALHTLEELHNKTADCINSLINKEFKIIPDKSVSYDPHIFNVTLYNKYTNQIVEICTKEIIDYFTRSIEVHCSLGGGSSQTYNVSYYKAHDNIYADSEDEAKEERKKWLDTNFRKKLLDTNLRLCDTCCKNQTSMFSDIFGNLEFMW